MFRYIIPAVGLYCIYDKMAHRKVSGISEAPLSIRIIYDLICIVNRGDKMYIKVESTPCKYTWNENYDYKLEWYHNTYTLCSEWKYENITDANTGDIVKVVEH